MQRPAALLPKVIGALVYGLILVDECRGTEPFGGIVRRIPGVIEAEDFDEGEAEAAFHDLTEANHGADYRGRTQVDIERRPDASNGHGIGWTRAGEWLAYTVEAADAGPYTLEIPVASATSGGRFHIEFDGNDATGPIAVPDTGAWTKLETVRVDGVRVPGGRSVMKVVMDADGESKSIGDIDCFRFSRPQPGSPAKPR
jgi:chitinase